MKLFVTGAATKLAPEMVPLCVCEVHLLSSGAAESPLYLEEGFSSISRHAVIWTDSMFSYSRQEA